MTNIQLVNQQGEILSQALSKLNTARSKYNDAKLKEDELLRQLRYHQSNNDQTNANIVNAQYVPALNLTVILKAELDQAQLTYNDELKKYTDLKNSLLSDEEKKQAELNLQAQNVLAEKAIIEQAKANEKNFMQGTTKYFIYGAIALVVIIVIIVIYRKKFKP